MLASNTRQLISVLISCCGLVVNTTSQAALFDDTEARKRILELETKQTSDHDAQQSVINDLTRTQKSLEKRLQSLEALVNGKGLLDMQNQLDQAKQDIAQLKGDLEVVTHQIEDMTAKQNALYADIDTRLRRLETAGTAANQTSDAVVGSDPTATDKAKTDVTEQESRAFSEADSLSQSGKYKEAFNAYDNFLKNYSGSKLTPDALYGMGYSQFALKNYKSAVATQQKFIDSYASHPLAPNAMFNMANSQIQLGQIPAAKKTLKDLIIAYPASDVTPSAQKRLKVLESFK